MSEVSNKISQILKDTAQQAKIQTKKMVSFEDTDFDLRDLKRIKRDEIYHQDADLFPDNISYRIVFVLQSYPFEIAFDFTTHEVRENRYKAVKVALEEYNVEFIDVF